MDDRHKLNEQEWYSLMDLIKILSSSIKQYIDTSQVGGIVDHDLPLISMQVLSYLASIGRGYDEAYINEMWQRSVVLSKSIYKEARDDKAQGEFQTFNIPTTGKN